MSTASRRLAWPALFAAAAVCAAAHAADILASRGDDGRTGANLEERILTPARVASPAFGYQFEYDIGGTAPAGEKVEVYAQPLVVSRLGIPGGGVADLVLVATSNNDVFAFDANEPRPGTSGVVWTRQLGPAPTMDDVWSQCGIDKPCLDHGSNLHGRAGILSTPVIDRRRHLLFVMARVVHPDRSVEYQLHALDLATGAERAGSPVRVAAQAAGVVFEPNYQNQRVGLALARGHVVIGFGSYADVLPYHGWVLSYDYQDGGGFVQTGAFTTTPDGDTSGGCALSTHADAVNNCAHGGIWMSGRAPAIDANGDVLLMVGNGRNDLGAPPNRNFGNSLLRLDPVTLAVKDFYTPSNHRYLNATDLDLGGSGPMIVPGTRLVVGGGKEGVMHVWRLDALGGFQPAEPGVVQRFPAGDLHLHADTGNDMPGGAVIGGIVISPHAGHIMGGPVYWPRPDDQGGDRLYHWSENAELRAYAVQPAGNVPISLPPEHLGADFQAGHPGGILTLSANGGRRDTGIVWASTYDATDTSDPVLGTTGALNRVVPGTLRAYAADDLAPLWNSDLTQADKLGDFAKFTPPTVANGRVYAATFSRRLVVYGLRDHAYGRPAANLVRELGEPLFQITLPSD